MKRVWRKYIQNCRRRNIFWEIGVDDFARLTSRACEYCGAEPKNRSRAYRYNGLDRVKNKLGYTLSNVVPCCFDCNQLKSNKLTFDEMKAVAKVLKELRRKQ